MTCVHNINYWWKSKVKIIMSFFFSIIIKIILYIIKIYY